MITGNFAPNPNKVNKCSTNKTMTNYTNSETFSKARLTSTFCADTNKIQIKQVDGDVS